MQAIQAMEEKLFLICNNAAIKHLRPADAKLASSLRWISSHFWSSARGL